jgi:hypothetical protein
LVFGVKFVVSTTSVLPSQRPRESPSHERIAGGRCGRPSRDDPRVVDHLVHEHDVIGRLQNLHVVVIRPREHRRPGVEQQAAFAEGTILGAVGRVLPPRVGAGGSAHLAVRGQGGNPSVRRIDDQRAARLPVHPRHVDPAVPPELVVRAGNVGGGIRVAIVAVAPLGGALLELLRVRVGQEFAARELGGPLERRDRRKVPDALQVRMPVDRARHLRRRLRNERRRSQQHDYGDERRQSLVHVILPG